ncbi:DUF3800 domain-containing protein [Cellulomonas cellasea]|uniref:DUF3800 domain-containing protein n=1 Tax=Cellulomonas cellasea TaxID=43670 RepID=UPI0025A31A27|nr:DUF3800 domain-containing protein [Cellulomonas cellasea]MDM8083816.1 DUF3800 domain-containing protein [Cellulomonas cellasea]
MRIAYVDDTKQRGKRAGMGSLVALGAAIFDEEMIQPFAQAFRAVYRDFDVPPNVELKWANPREKSWWAESAENRAKQTPFRKRMLEVAEAHEVKVIVVIWDLGAGISSAGGEGPEDAVVTFMFERISMQIENSGERGIIVFDKPGGDHRDEAAWLTSREEMVRVGTEYVKPNAIVTQVLTAPSHLHPHLQLADLVAGSVTAAVAGNRYGTELIPLIKPMFCTGNWGIGQAGLKLYPDALNNLHYWVHGGTSYGRGQSGIGLPYEGAGWRYATHDGL